MVSEGHTILVISLPFRKQLLQILQSSLYIPFLSEFQGSSTLAITENFPIAKPDHATIVGCPLNVYCLLLLVEDQWGYALCFRIES